MTTYKSKKKRRLRKLPFVILGLIVLSILLIFWIKSSYENGIQFARDHGKKEQTYKFDGPIKKDGKVNVLILGQDRVVDGSSRTDSIMVAQYDYLHKKMKLMSIMRDIYAEVPGYQNYKINTAYTLGGPELLRQTLKKNLDIDLEYYAIIDFKGFEQMVDELSPNGVPINVEKDMSEKIGVELKKGQHNLSGKELLGYARFRNDEESDFGRVRRQQQVIKALQNEVISLSTAPKVPKLAGIARGYVDTNMSNGEIFKTGASFAIRGDKDIQTLVVPVKDSFSFQDVYGVGSVLDIDKEMNKKAIKDFLDK
ncbi:LytR family transcriptional regulator [Macrococcus hajekii]|uniref:Regulatory protein MsrR n=1 Tax=Macrococcus hajekii TaxID=198482 RepID=A0A4R6BMM5_9STAP|nr:LCP family protein [Macrococcus hajekii]TDM03066.1 LytR family transcriptional regulator [Macrococcus hajekii]GGB06291.1 LytR family transcriptional regulator [Macrococcus hajekii]